ALPAGAGAGDLLADVSAADPAIAERIRLVLVHRLDADATALAADVADLAGRDDARRDHGLPPTGLTDDVRYIAAGVVSSRDAQRDALHDVIHAHPDTLVRRMTEHRLEADDAARADQLLT